MKQFQVKKPAMNKDEWFCWFVEVVDMKAKDPWDPQVSVSYCKPEDRVRAIRLAERIAKLLNADIPRPPGEVV